MHKIAHLTKEQNQWLKDYHNATGFEPMHLDEIENRSMSFNDAAKRNIVWYEDHMNETMVAISFHIPYDDEPSNTASTGQEPSSVIPSKGSGGSRLMR